MQMKNQDKTKKQLIDELAELRHRNAELEKAEEELRDKEKFYRSILDFVPAHIGIADNTGKITYVNKSWMDFSGRTLEEESGWGWAKNVHPEDVKQTEKVIKEAIAKRKAYLFEYRYKGADGQYHWLLDNTVPFDIGGKEMGIQKPIHSQLH